MIIKSFARSGVFVRWRKLARMCLHAVFGLGVLSQAAVLHAQAAPFDVATAVSADVEPVERTFDIPASGQYKLTLSDLGGLRPIAPAPLASGNVLITRGTTVVASVSTSADPGHVDTATFDATAGTYKVHIVGKPGSTPGSGPVRVEVTQVGTAIQVLDMGAALSPPQRLQPGVATYQVDINVTPSASGDYTLSVTDLAFPTAGVDANVYLLSPQSQTQPMVVCAFIPANTAACPSATVTLAAGDYVLFVVGGLRAPVDGGVLNVKLQGANGTLHNRNLELGRVQRLSAQDFQLDSGNHSLRFVDLAFPAALQQGSAVVTVNGLKVATATATASNPTSEATFAVPSNDTAADVFAYVRPSATENAGS